ncbi:type II toxin-antitoxin system Phd/YefM family antitoxin [Schumannella soli]|uniref:Antitoxin n=1 Tax=Schumannella soli TaxID=2590779 RepID=A0A506Y9C2_9MICO|nr:type II toxin-antitoxin system Phd/YefM family antitoxin [Schumannella soli]TPW78090.1 type II toxin-antitoxin system Phd/YefM family antitoxin [Schumannella soli]
MARGAPQTLTSFMPMRALRNELADVVDRANYGQERIGVTRHGRLAAVFIGPDDLELLEQLEDARDVVELQQATADDDGGRVSLGQLRDGLA